MSSLTQLYNSDKWEKFGISDEKNCNIFSQPGNNPSPIACFLSTFGWGSLNKNLGVQTFKGIRCSLSFPGNLYGWWENFTSFAFSWELAFRQSRMRHSALLRVDFKWLSVLYAPFIVIHMSLKIIRYFPSKATKVQVLACKSVRIHFELNNFVNFSCLVYLIGKIGW